ncbi:MAG: peptidoglycan DD-metalloendopeptidase family protein [Nitrosomonas sp.]|nr:peptidoglycan DD-metalloendopeptidase family protein [Nitrosomonas sp.]
MRDTERLIIQNLSRYNTVCLHADKKTRQLTYFYTILVVLLCVVIAGCASTKEPVQVVDKALNDTAVRSNDGVIQKEGDYIVQRRDTLYSIAVRHGIPLSELAKWNNISDPNSIEPGQTISLSVPATKQVQPSVFPLGQPVISAIEPSSIEAVEPIAIDDQIKREPKGLKLPYSGQTLAEMQYMANMPTTTPSMNQNPATNRAARIEIAPPPDTAAVRPPLQNNANIEWIWPAPGKLLEGFSKDTKGVRISGQSGQAVLASASGEVVYSGDGLRGYGKLIIIKHNNTFLSAYAYNSLLLVKEGDRVAKGQKIAEMGNTDTDTVQLHFEIREQGKPVDPLKYLPSRSG